MQRFRIMQLWKCVYTTTEITNLIVLWILDVYKQTVYLVALLYMLCEHMVQYCDHKHKQAG